MLQEVSLHVRSSQPLSFNWEGYGLRLEVPAQSLPSNIDSCTITIVTSLSGQYQFPADCELVSPVFWLRCEPRVEFQIPLVLEIQHCAPLDNSLQLSMVTAHCTQRDLPYIFEVLRGGTFTEKNKYGVIALKKFSAKAVVQRGSDKKLYWSCLFYMGPLTNREIHITVTKQLDAHITVSYLSYHFMRAFLRECSYCYSGAAIFLMSTLE